MNEMKLEQMEQIIAGGEQRTCLILGELAFTSFFLGFIPTLQAGWIAAITLTGAAAVYGCFD